MSGILLIILFFSMPKSKAQKTSSSSRPVKKVQSKGRKSLGKQILTTGGQLLGSGIGDLIGVPGLGKIGRSAGAFISKITGMGDYKISSNSLMTGQRPSFTNSNTLNNGGIRIKHREFIENVVTSGDAFNSKTYILNPGLVQSFPFLSTLANSFEQYHMNGLVWEYVSTSADALNSTNTALGVVVISTTYDPLDSPFTDKQQMEAYMFTSSGAPSSNQLHPVECAPGVSTLRNLYVRATDIPANADAHFYDMGITTIATQGQQAACTIGELWVSYDITLLKPKIETPLGASTLCYHARFTPTTGALFTNPVRRSGSTITCTYPTTNSIAFPNVGRYCVVIAGQSGTSVSMGVPASSTGATLVSAFFGGSATYANGGAGTTMQVLSFVVDISSENSSIGLSASTITGASPQGDVYVSQVSSGLSSLKVLPSLAKLMEKFDEQEKQIQALKDVSDRKTPVVITPIQEKEEFVLVPKSSVKTG